MLAESLETMREHVVHRFNAGIGAGSASDGDSRGAVRDVLPRLLDDLSASLRRGRVEPAPLPFDESAPPTQCMLTRLPSGFDPAAAVGEYRLLGECIYAVIEERNVDVSLHELRILSDWLTARASAPVLARSDEVSEQNRRFAALLDAVPDPITAVHREGRLCYLNRAARAIAHEASGVPIDDVVGRDWRDVGYPSDPSGDYGEHLAEASAGATVTTEIVYETPHGARWFEHKLSPIYREDGSLVSVAAISRDIHDRKRAQARLSLLSKLGALAGTLDYEQALSAVARLSIPELADWCIVDAVEEGEARRVEVAHRDPASAPLAAALRAFKLDHAARQRLPVVRALQSGQPLLISDYTDEMLREETQGEYLDLVRRLHPCSVLVIPVTLPGSIATMAFIMTPESGRRYGQEDVALADELVRRAAQIVENARVHQMLRQTEQRFRVALAHSNITLFEQDVESRYRWVYNPPRGLHAADVVGKTNDDLFPPEEAARVNALDRAVLRAGERVQEELQITPPRGDTLHLLVSQEPLRDASGAIVGLTGAATDITDQKRAQEELSQALAFREQMMGILGHDLRNPLGAVRVLASLLLRRKDVSEGARESLLEIERAGKRMLEMIGTLLDFTESRFKGSVPLAPVPADIHEMCRTVIKELMAAEPDRTIELDLEADGHGTWDPARMAQVVSNLVANALKHGARHGNVRVSVGGDEEDVILKVTNQGPVIAPELMAVLFEPFCRGVGLGDASHARGLGLGLYIARQIVDAHGGAISVESTRERGTTFTVRLPRAGAMPSAEAHRESWQGDAAAGA
jgi:PAS domain S-box-containing protein